MAVTMPKFLQRFARHLDHLSDLLQSLKQFGCPFCGALETLNCHSKLQGNDPDGDSGQARKQRGQRVWCSNRGQRGGCGRSFSVFLAEVLPGHTVTSRWLWGLLKGLVSGGSIKAVIESLTPPFAPETLYHVLHRLRERLAAVRTALFREAAPPTCSHRDPLFQTTEHLRRLFAQSDCPIAQFQLHFQRSLLE
jgi:hypothetical protein